MCAYMENDGPGHVFFLMVKFSVNYFFNWDIWFWLNLTINHNHYWIIQDDWTIYIGLVFMLATSNNAAQNVKHIV